LLAARRAPCGFKCVVGSGFLCSRGSGVSRAGRAKSKGYSTFQAEFEDIFCLSFGTHTGASFVARGSVAVLDSVAAWPLAAHAQQPGKLPTIGYIGALPDVIRLQRSPYGTSLPGAGLGHGARDPRASEVGLNFAHRRIARSTTQDERGMGKTVVAEGVEDAAPLAAIRRLKCDIAQGYPFSRPIPAADVVSLVAHEFHAHDKNAHGRRPGAGGRGRRWRAIRDDAGDQASCSLCA
jgi:hypothetical protein